MHCHDPLPEMIESTIALRLVHPWPCQEDLFGEPTAAAQVAMTPPISTPIFSKSQGSKTKHILGPRT